MLDNMPDLYTLYNISMYLEYIIQLYKQLYLKKYY